MGLTYSRKPTIFQNIIYPENAVKPANNLANIQQERRAWDPPQASTESLDRTQNNINDYTDNLNINVGKLNNGKYLCYTSNFENQSSFSKDKNDKFEKMNENSFRNSNYHENSIPEDKFENYKRCLYNSKNFNENLQGKSDKLFLNCAKDEHSVKLDEDAATSSNNQSKQFVPRLPNQITLASFSRSTRDRIIVGATDLSKSAGGAMRKYCKKTTAHGFSHIVEPNSSLLLRTFWGIATFICLVVMAQLVYEATRSAFVIRRPYSEVSYEDTRVSGQRLPDITICDLAGFWKSKMAKYNISTTMGSYILIALRGVGIMSPYLTANSRMTLHTDLVKLLNTYNVTLSELIHDITPQCNEIVLSCYTPTEEMLAAECCEKLFRPYITSIGVCHSSLGFDSLDMTQKVAGIMGGIKILFANHPEEYMDFNKNIVSGLTLSDTGVQVSLTYSSSVTPTVASNTHAVTIGNNVMASITIQTTKLYRTESYTDIWPWSERQCISEDDLLVMTKEQLATVEGNIYWTVQYRDCSLQLVNCSALPFKISNDIKGCLPEDLFTYSLQQEDMDDCIKTKMAEMYSNGALYALCMDPVITQQLSYTDFNIERVVNMTIPDKLSPSMVNIYHSQLGYTKYYQRVPTITTWFSDLGGQMGLFLGASLITVIELTFMAVYVIRRFLVNSLMFLLDKCGWYSKDRKMNMSLDKKNEHDDSVKK